MQLASTGLILQSKQSKVSASKGTALLGTCVGPCRVSVCKCCISCRTGHVWFVPACVQLVYQLGSPTKGAAMSRVSWSVSLSGDHTVSFRSLEVPWECAVSVWMYGFFCLLAFVFLFVCFKWWLCVFALLVVQCIEPFANSQQSPSTAFPDSPELHLQSKLGTPAWAPKLWLSGLSIKLCCCSWTYMYIICPFHRAWGNHIC